MVSTNFLRTSSAAVVYRKDVDELAGEYLSEYETIHMSVDLTADEREEYDEGVPDLSRLRRQPRV